MINHITDVHTHYDELVFDADRDAVLKQMHKNGVCAIINSGSSVPSSQRSVALAAQYSFVWASVGVFPLEAYTVPKDWLQSIRIMAGEQRVVAIGEIGLDYFQPDADRKCQKKVFLPQIELANELKLPVVIHDRDADEDMIAILKEHPVKGMIHRFFSKAEYGFALLELGLSLGIGPAITYSNADELIEVVKKMPLDRLLLETDCPFLPPVQLEGQRATSDMITYVVEKIAEVRGDITPQQVADIALENARRMFRLPGLEIGK